MIYIHTLKEQNSDFPNYFFILLTEFWRIKMNKLMLLFILILTVTTFAFSDETNDLDKWSIVVFDFKPINVSKTFADTITESIITKIVKTEEYIVFERSQLNKIFKEIKLTSGDDFTDENIYKPEIRFTEI